MRIDCYSHPCLLRRLLHHYCAAHNRHLEHICSSLHAIRICSVPLVRHCLPRTQPDLSRAAHSLLRWRKYPSRQRSVSTRTCCCPPRGPSGTLPRRCSSEHNQREDTCLYQHPLLRCLSTCIELCGRGRPSCCPGGAGSQQHARTVPHLCCLSQSRRSLRLAPRIHLDHYCSWCILSQLGTCPVERVQFWHEHIFLRYCLGM